MTCAPPSAQVKEGNPCEVGVCLGPLCPQALLKGYPLVKDRTASVELDSSWTFSGLINRCVYGGNDSYLTTRFSVSNKTLVTN